MYDYSRGEIYYICRNYTEVGSEQYAGRPAIIVSNDANNKNSDVIEVVYLTTRPKNDLPTHVDIKSSSAPSIALCEQVYSLSKERIGDYVGACSHDEMERINAALMISLGIDMPEPKDIEKVVEKEAVKTPPTSDSKLPTTGEIIAKVTAERDVYKKLYKELLGTTINGGTSE